MLSPLRVVVQERCPDGIAHLFCSQHQDVDTELHVIMMKENRHAIHTIKQENKYISG